MASKYWVANNPNSEINDTKAQQLAELSATGVSLAELNGLDADALSCTITSASATPSAGAANEFAVQLKDAAGDNIAKVVCFDFYLSTDSAGLASAVATEAIADGGAGGININLGTAAICGKGITDAAGLCEIDVTETGIALYFNVILPDGSLTTSAVCTWAS